MASSNLPGGDLMKQNANRMDIFVGVDVSKDTLDVYRTPLATLWHPLWLPSHRQNLLCST